MSYIGTPPSNAFTSLLKQDFSTSATTGYTLDHAVNNANDIALFINFVRQEPTAGYAASGTTLTLTSATASSDDMYCVYLGQALQTVNPANASVGLSQLTATGTKDSTTFLRGDNTFATAGGTNTPAFSVSKSSQTTGQSDNTWTKITYDTENFDSDGKFASDKFTPTVSGKYYIEVNASAGTSSASSITSLAISIYKNGSVIDYTTNTHKAEQELELMMQSTSIIVDLDTDDYVEAYIKIDFSTGTGRVTTSQFSGYKILT